MNAPQILIALAAAIIGALGAMHLYLTFFSTALHPRDEILAERMAEDHPQLTRGTTMWRAWIGFNASHSLGALLFALAYGYLALMQPALLFGTSFLITLGLVMLLSLAALARAYWFSKPQAGIAFATVLYLIGMLMSLMSS